MSFVNTIFVTWLILFVFVNSNVNTAQQQYLNLLQSLSFVTSFILPIAYYQNEWTISPSHPQCSQQIDNQNNIISLSTFLNHLIQQHKNESIKLRIISFPNTNIKQIINLYKIINYHQNDIHIANIIISPPSNSQSHIIELMTSHSIPITAYLDPLLTSAVLSSSNMQRSLLSNVSNTNYIDMINIPNESWICKSWPIYISFFAGIGVTSVITLAIKFSMGEHDDDLSRALEKVVHAGIKNKSNEQNMRPSDISMLRIQNPITVITPHHSPRVHSSSMAMPTLPGQPGHPRDFSMSVTGNPSPRHTRKVTFADEKKEKLVKPAKDVDVKGGGTKKKKDVEIQTGLPVVSTTLFEIPSSHAVMENIADYPSLKFQLAASSASMDSVSDLEDEHFEAIVPSKMRAKISVDSESEMSIGLIDIDVTTMISDRICSDIDADRDPSINSDGEEVI